MPRGELLSAHFVIREWHPLRNSEIEPDDFTLSSKQKVWWLCSQGHEWESSINNRVRGANCPYCSGKKPVIGENDLATLFPGIVSQWHPTKNKTLDPKQLLSQSNKKAWWVGECGHEWESSIQARTKDGHGCPFCSGNRLLPGFNDLLTKNPDIAAQWHPTNNEFGPDSVSASSNKPVWWLGECGHEWKAGPNSRTKKIKPTGCPVCHNLAVLPGFNDLHTSHPEISKNWHPTKNTIKPSEVSSGSNKMIWWLGECGHEWEFAVKYVTKRGVGCPFCSKNKILSGFNDLATLNPDLAALWHSTKNGQLTPDVVPVRSNKKAWFECDKGHEWEEVIDWASSRCGFCAGLKLITGENDLATTHSALSSQWHPTKNGDVTPFDITASTVGRKWWICAQGHEWESPLHRRLAGHGCPVCAGQRVDTGSNDLVTLRPEIAIQWHPTKNELPASEYMVGSGKKVWWHCDSGHEWSAKIADRTRLDGNANGCPFCFKRSSRMEKELVTWIETQNSDLSILTNTRSLIHPFELDAYMPELAIAIEFNGVYWHGENHKGKTYHYDKWNACRQKGVQLIQIWEDEWVSSPEVVKKMLAHKLGFSQQDKISARKTIVSEISHDEASIFLLDNHIQGAVVGSYTLGLKDKNTQELVAVLVTKWTNAQRDTLDILRFATSKNVRGGFTKLLAYLEKNTLGLNKIITFSDNCVSDGKLYRDNDFTEDKSLAPDYRYVVNNKRVHKFGYRLKRFKNDNNLIWQDGLTETELATLNGLQRIWDAGKIRWVKEIVRQDDNKNTLNKKEHKNGN